MLYAVSYQNFMVIFTFNTTTHLYSFCPQSFSIYLCILYFCQSFFVLRTLFNRFDFLQIENAGIRSLKGIKLALFSYIFGTGTYKVDARANKFAKRI